MANPDAPQGDLQAGTDGNLALELLASAETIDADGNTQESIAGPSPEDDAMAAGYKQAATGDGSDVKATLDKASKVEDAPAAVETPVADKPEAVVLDGMTPTELRERLAKIDALEKSGASVAGRVGHLQQMLEANARGKPITKDMLSRVSAEFGEEYADALAADLSAAGLGGGGGIDSKAVGDIVEERVAQRAEALERKFEFKAVKRDHPDALDYFAGGKHNAQFVGWVQSLPEARQKEIANSWDSETVGGALSEFKGQLEKAAKGAARQKSRMADAVVPTDGAVADAVQPVSDPMLAGWNRAKGVSGAKGAQRAGGR